MNHLKKFNEDTTGFFPGIEQVYIDLLELIGDMEESTDVNATTAAQLIKILNGHSKEEIRDIYKHLSTNRHNEPIDELKLKLIEFFLSSDIYDLRPDSPHKGK